MSHCPTCTCTPEQDPFGDREGKRHRKAGSAEAAAARDIRPKSGTQRREVFETVARFHTRTDWHPQGGINDVRGSEWSGVYHQSWLARIGELMDDGLVYKSDDSAPTGHGGNGQLRRLTPLGEKIWRELNADA